MMNNLCLKYFWHKKKRTITSIIGIALAIVLVVGIGGIFESFKKLEIDSIRSSGGDWHYKLSYKDKEKNKTQNLAKLISLKHEFIYGNMTLTAIPVSNDMDKNFALLQKFTDYVKEGSYSGLTNAFDKCIALQDIVNYKDDRTYANSAMKSGSLIEGRVAENENEIVLSDECKSMVDENSEINLAFAPGSKEEVLGVLANIDLENPDFEKAVKNLPGFGFQKFKVVGYYNGYNNEGYTYGLNLSVPDSQYDAFVKVNENEKDYRKALSGILSECGIDESEVEIKENTFLLQVFGQDEGKSDYNGNLISIFVVIAVFILFLMGIVIKNSISMSVSDKVEQFGILRCLGATERQIKGMVIKEALMMWCFALVIGYLVSFLGIHLVILFMKHLDLGQNMQFVLPTYECLIAAILSFITIIVFSYFPAKKASEVSPVDAVRGTIFTKTENIKRTKKGFLLGKIFKAPGFFASKNIRRDKKRFRSTIFSITTALIMFVVFSSVSIQVDSSVKQLFSFNTTPFSFSLTSEKAKRDPERKEVKNLVADLKNTEGVEDAVESDLIGGLISSERMPCYFVGREAYDKLEFKGAKPSYDELVSKKGGVISQKIIEKENGKLVIKDLKLKEINDVVSFEDKAKNTNVDVTILGELKNAPWFVNFSSGTAMVIVPKEIVSDYLSSSMCFVSVKCKNGYEESLSRHLKNQSKENEIYHSFLFLNIYEGTKQFLNVIKILELFMIIFVGIIVLICFVNLVNTISANLQSRKSEIATLRSIGMSKKQLVKMLVLECVLYGFISTVIGSIISIGLEYLFFKVAFASTADVMLNIPLTCGLCLIALVSTTIICLWSGYGQIKKIVRTSIIDGIRSRE